MSDFVNSHGISIIIPVYNREKYIAQAIDSILNQNYPGKLEIIVSDDGSTDQTINIVNSYNNDSRIKLLRKTDCMEQGAAAARNRGLLAATQPYICFLDSDDYQLPGFLGTMLHGITSHSYADFAFCRTLIQKEKDGKIKIKPWTRYKITSFDVKYLGLTRIRTKHTNTFIFKKEILLAAGGFNGNYSNAEDTDLWIRLGEKFKGVFIDYVGVVRRMHEGEQLTKNILHANKCSLDVLEKALERSLNAGADSFRIYSIKSKILAIKKKRIQQIILMISQPVNGLKHLYLLMMNTLDVCYLFNRYKKNE